MQGTFTLEYCPLKVGPSQGRLELRSSELGDYVYDVNLQATKPNAECELRFDVSLGRVQTVVGRFVNLSKTRVDFSSRVSKLYI